MFLLVGLGTEAFGLVFDMPFLSLPLEVKEQILILCAEEGAPTTVAAIAQTCRHCRALIYSSLDQHLWHRLFLTTFDDPYGLRFVDLGESEQTYLYGGEGACSLPFLRSKDHFDWGTAFRERVWTRLYITQHAKPLFVGRLYSLRSRGPNVSLIDFPAPCDVESSTRALKALVSVIQTSSPSRARLAEHAQSSDSSGNTTHNPLTGTLGHTSRTTPVFYHERNEHSNDTHHDSKNISWLRTVLANGYAAPLSMKLTAATVDHAWDDTEEAQAFYKLISCTGFVPVQTQTLSVHDTEGRANAHHHRGRSAHGAGSSASSNTNSRPSLQGATLTSLDLDEAAQRKRARHLARTRTYNLKYLKRRRHWGPFLPLSVSAENVADSPSAAASGPSPLVSGALGTANNVPSQDLLLSDSDSSDDSDFVPSLSEVDDDAGADPDSPAASPSVSPAASPVPVRAKLKAPRLAPTPDRLVADWAWLASARVVVEANLREMEEMPERLEALVSLENVREGAWVARRGVGGAGVRDGAEDGVDKEGKGKGKGARTDTEEDSIDGWDWAGVEGVWRRCVCWFDYSDLIRGSISFMV